MHIFIPSFKKRRQSRSVCLRPLSNTVDRRSKSLKNTEKENIQNNDNKKLVISEKERRAFLTALKIGYYKEFHKQGILSDEELEYLINLQKKYTA